MTTPNKTNPAEEDVLKTNEESKDLDQTKSATTPEVPSFGWSAYAERVNGRFAMIGFIAVLIVEALSKEAFLNWAGLIQ